MLAGWEPPIHGAELTPMTLEAALRLAVDRNADLRALEARVDQESAAVRIALARVLPQAILIGSYTRYDQGVSLGEQSVVELDELVGAGELAVPLFQPRALGEYLAADRALDAFRAGARRSGEEIALAVIQLYIGVLRAEALETAAREAIARRESFFRAAEQRLARGATDRSEVHRARLSLLEASTARDQAAAEAALARQALAVVLQLAPGADLEIAGENAGPPRPLLAASGGETVERRSDLRAQDLLLERDSLASTFAWLSFLPDLEIAAGFAKGPPSFRDPDGLSWQVQLRAELPLYDGGERYGLIDLEDATRELHEAELARLTLEAERERLAATVRIEQLERQLAVAIESQKIAEQYREDANRRLEAGIGTLLEVLDAEVQLSTTDAASDTTQHDLWLAEWQLVHAAGKLNEMLETEARP